MLCNARRGPRTTTKRAPVKRAKKRSKKASPRRRRPAKARSRPSDRGTIDLEDAVPPAAAVEFHTVALGASAGGLGALESFFAATPGAPGVAFVVLTHQSASHVSLLPELLSRHTRMRVELVQDGVELRPDRVFVARPGKHLTVSEGRLRTIEPSSAAEAHRPIDYFFGALARDQGQLAIGVVLSGAGVDGTDGVRAIDALGGMVMVQDETSAEYAGMPRSAAATGVADHLLSPDEMPGALLRYVRGSARDARVTAELELSEDVMAAICRLVRVRTGHDFAGYKSTTIRRRIDRHMRNHSMVDPVEYVRLLQADPGEIDSLFRELLIGVTSFFRDAEAFAALEIALRRQRTRKADEAVLRVWVPACSTGEEAYSIAMLLAEFEWPQKRRAVQVFATDLDAESIEFARAGSYPDAAVRELNLERLERFFVKTGDRWRVAKEIREMVVFAVQNVVQDPPFTRLDLISCRNLLIYLDGELQSLLLSIFHYALAPSGLLLLGSSETTGAAERLFSPVDRKWKLYERLRTVAGPPASLERLLPKGLPRSLAHRLLVSNEMPGASRSGKPPKRERRSRQTAALGKPSARKLRAANEELQSMNEELQSTNEELETSGEELQSLNEELQTMNGEFQTKLEQLSRANDDMQNLLNSTEIPTLFLDGDLKIIRFTERVREVISILPCDIGRPVNDLVSLLHYDALARDARKVLDTVTPYETEVQTKAGAWRLLRIFPYRTSRGAIDGVVVTFLDAGRVKRAELLAASRAFAQSIVQTVREPLVVLDAELKVVSANRAFLETFAVRESEVENRLLFEVVDGFFTMPRLRQLLDDTVALGVPVEDMEVDQPLPAAGRRRFLLNARRLEAEGATAGHVLLVLSDAGAGRPG